MLEEGKRYLVKRIQIYNTGWLSGLMEVMVLEKSLSAYKIKIDNDRVVWVMKEWEKDIIEELGQKKTIK